MSLSQDALSRVSLPQTQPSGSQPLTVRGICIRDEIRRSLFISSTTPKTTSSLTPTTTRRTPRCQALFEEIISTRVPLNEEPSSSQISITSNSSYCSGSQVRRRELEPSSSPVTSRCSSPDELHFSAHTRTTKEVSSSSSVVSLGSSSNSMAPFPKPKFFVDFGSGSVDIGTGPGVGSVVERCEAYLKENQQPKNTFSRMPYSKRKRAPSLELFCTPPTKRQGMMSVLCDQTNVKTENVVVRENGVIEILDSDDEDYVPQSPKRQKTTTQVRQTRTIVKKVETIVKTEVTVLEVTNMGNSLTKIKTEPEPPLSQFFSKYPSFEHNPKVSSSQEFKRLSAQFGWDHNAYQKHGEEFCLAAVEQFSLFYGTSVQDLDSWKRFFEAIGEEDCPDSVGQCILAVKNIHINIMDLVDKPLSGREIRRFPSEAALGHYSKMSGKFFPRRRVINGSFLEFLLRYIR